MFGLWLFSRFTPPLNIVLIHLCHSCHSHCFQQESEQVLPTHILCPFALASSTTRQLEFSAWTITRAFAGDTQLVYHCVSSGNGGTVKDTGSKCVEPIFQPISNNFSIIFKWVSFRTVVTHHLSLVSVLHDLVCQPPQPHVLLHPVFSSLCWSTSVLHHRFLITSLVLFLSPFSPLWTWLYQRSLTSLNFYSIPSTPACCLCFLIPEREIDMNVCVY